MPKYFGEVSSDHKKDMKLIEKVAMRKRFFPRGISESQRCLYLQDVGWISYIHAHGVCKYIVTKAGMRALFKYEDGGGR